MGGYRTEANPYFPPIPREAGAYPPRSLYLPSYARPVFAVSRRSFPGAACSLRKPVRSAGQTVPPAASAAEGQAGEALEGNGHEPGHNEGDGNPLQASRHGCQIELFPDPRHENKYQGEPYPGGQALY